MLVLTNLSGTEHIESVTLAFDKDLIRGVDRGRIHTHSEGFYTS
jgi:hypothetical protein